jgi:DNA-directed RNA polymerase specialized sigma24 family protein
MPARLLPILTARILPAFLTARGLPRGTVSPCDLAAFRWCGLKTFQRCVSQEEMPGSQKIISGFCWREGELMSKADAVVQHLPYLRRYARALTGNQVSGDAYVAATLEALVKEPDLLETSDLHRVTLFRLFSTIWNSISVKDARELPTNEMAAERNLSQITPKPRQAFLLVSVEGFSEEHAARILDVDAPTLRQLLEESGRELAAQIATVLIIEDKALIALDLQISREFLASNRWQVDGKRNSVAHVGCGARLVRSSRLRIAV